MRKYGIGFLKLTGAFLLLLLLLLAVLFVIGHTTSIYVSLNAFRVIVLTPVALYLIIFFIGFFHWWSRWWVPRVDARFPYKKDK